MTRGGPGSRLAGRVVVCVAAVSIAFGVISGCAAAPSRVPELDRPRTESDVVPGEWWAPVEWRARFGPSFFPDTARLIGSVRGADVYVGVGPSRAVRTDVQFCLIAVERDGASSACGRLPVSLQTGRLDMQLVGIGAQPEGRFRLLGESVLVAD